MLKSVKSAFIALVRPDKVICSPVHVQIEHTTYCNLSCPQCPREDYLDKPRHMSFENYKKVVDKLNPSAITLNGLGESLMHPEILGMIRYAKESGSSINTTSNFIVLPEVIIAGLLGSGLDFINISVDASSAATYKIVRRSDAFYKVIDNCREFIKAAKRSGPQIPLVRLCFVIQKSNLDEMVPFYLLAGELGADAIFFQTFAFNGQTEGQDIAQNTNIEKMHVNLREIMMIESKLKSPVSNAYHLSRKIKSIRNHYANIDGDGFKKCIMPWISLYVSVEGEIRPCCSFSGTRYPMGNVFDTENIMDVYNNEKYILFRSALRKCTAPHPVCAQCLPESIWDVFRSKVIRGRV